MNPHTSSLSVAIDFGTSNTDLVVIVNGELCIVHQSHVGLPDAELVRSLLASAHIERSTLGRFAVTGGHHQLLPPVIDGVPVTPVNEVQAIGRGGQALAGLTPTSSQPILIISGGSYAMYTVRWATLKINQIGRCCTERRKNNFIGALV